MFHQEVSSHQTVPKEAKTNIYACNWCGAHHIRPWKTLGKSEKIMYIIVNTIRLHLE